MRRGSARWEDATRTDETSVRVRVLEHLASLGKQTTAFRLGLPFCVLAIGSHEDASFTKHETNIYTALRIPVRASVYSIGLGVRTLFLNYAWLLTRGSRHLVTSKRRG